MPLVIVTGADGFLGSHIARHFDAAGWTVARVVRRGEAGPMRFVLDLPDRRLDELVGGMRPDVLVHAAGPASVPASVSDPAGDFRGAALTTSAVLDTLRRSAPACRFAYLSSGAVYGNATRGPVSESAPIAPVSPYGWHKRMCEMLCEEYAAIYGLRSTVFRLFSAYGEGQRKQVVHDLFRKIMAPEPGTLEVIGTGAEARDFIHGADVAAAMFRVLDADLSGPVNVGTGQATAISTLVDRMQAAAGSNKAVRFGGTARPGDPDVMNADIARLAACRFSPQISLDQGLRRYFEWLSANP